ncbi:MAG: hypothetical protein IJ242_13200, partial [Clostridia bacterium]|nr:hypothetical protein [Clostridia bacterium]
MNRISIWKFAMGESSGCLENARTVNVPHTWATDNSVQGVQGIGWYKTRLEVEQSEGQRTFLHFNGAYRDTRVWVNGNLAGEHYNAGYLPFEVEITPYLEDAGADIIVSV